MNDENTVDNSVDNPIEDVMDLFPTDHDVEDEAETDEITEETDTEESTTEDEESEESTEDDSEEETEESDTVALEDLEIKVNGEVKLMKDIPREELQSTVRKGEAFDLVREKLTTAQEEINEWNEIAQFFDMDTKGVKDALLNQHFTKIAEAEGISVERAKKEYQADKKSNQDKMYEKFLDKYPDVKVEDLPDTVTDAVKMGRDLMNVYQEHVRDTEKSEITSKLSEYESKIADLEAKLKVKTQNSKNKKNGVIKKTSGKDSNVETDDFLIGLMGD